jgi:hypothetical protein
MLRATDAAFAILILSALPHAGELRAGEICVACDKPAATYRCTFEQATRDAKFQVGETAQRHVCEQILAKTGPHERCRTALDVQPCDGAIRTVNLAEVQKSVID